MFFGFGLPIFQEPEQNQPNQGGGGGFLDFIANFMNPRAQPQEQPQQCIFISIKNRLRLDQPIEDPVALINR